MNDEQTKNSFSLRVETYAKDNEVLLVSALAAICEEYSIEPGKAPVYINKGLREKIEIEAEDHNMLKEVPAERASLFIE